MLIISPVWSMTVIKYHFYTITTGTKCGVFIRLTVIAARIRLLYSPNNFCSPAVTVISDFFYKSCSSWNSPTWCRLHLSGTFKPNERDGNICLNINLVPRCRYIALTLVFSRRCNTNFGYSKIILPNTKHYISWKVYTVSAAFNLTVYKYISLLKKKTSTTLNH